MGEWLDDEVSESRCAEIYVGDAELVDKEEERHKSS